MPFLGTVESTDVMCKSCGSVTHCTWVKMSGCMIAGLPAEQCQVLAFGPWLTPYKPEIAVPFNRTLIHQADRKMW